jgi:hypothetical protein
MEALRVILLVLHIASAGIWLGQVPVQFVLGRMIRRSEGKPGELTLLISQLALGGFMGNVGGIGILITGFGLIGIEQVGFLSLGRTTPAWLFIKQIVFIVTLVIAFAVIAPQQRKLRPHIAAAAESAGMVTPEIRQMAGAIKRAGLLISALVFINIVLVVWKPLFY